MTLLLTRARSGDRGALEQLAPLVQSELRRIARNRLRVERPGHTLQPTALINEAYIRLLKGAQPEWESRAHFFSVAARLMRQILTDHARARAAEKREWDCKVTLDHAGEIAPETPAAIVALNDAIEALRRADERKSQVIDLRYFGGLAIEEIGSALDISPATVRRDLRMGEAWLRREISTPPMHSV
ncbi:MAG: sigma-70 family RNA polymerase sigma factor [Candidatus Solibacter usitatus]|nr:sigma-70 family RNA polymerase sigma factor [Candidatus Solibacter usitatus]